MLILAGVAVSITVSPNGLFGQAENAVTKWNNRIAEEQDIVSELFQDYIGGQANAPDVKEGMIPVYYDNGWKKADKTKDNWYSYDTVNKKWANVVTVKETGTKTRAEYISAEEGTPIPEEDILAMFVWIPRYAYNITKGYHSTVANETGDIQIKFLNDATDDYSGGTALRQVDTNATTNGNKYVVHPAFTAESAGKEITGMWVGKFESSNARSPYNNEGITESSSDNLKRGKGDDTTGTNYGAEDVTIKPNVTSWRNTNVPTMFEVCLKMNDEGNIHGLTSTSDTRMMVNAQWGAVAYLTQSKYGNKQGNDLESGVWNNPYTEGYIYVNANNSEGYGMENYSTTLTGMVGSTRDENTARYSKVQANGKTDDGNSITIKYNNVNKVETDSNNDGTPDRRTKWNIRFRIHENIL